ncbi:sensor histidine kinase [Nonomuraea rhodomycinica]|uniref:histidine kinase n=1 Tax=Nonomuraea rhodomycinica TaxID=1712872 RepID=A0A7Y6MGG3_9ACTN|nr:ATP-binding protein [Nonomuraea rhodomycinica]NUW46025.1 hypothetical protein [Nonomuraea rhodomycinica]
MGVVSWTLLVGAMILYGIAVRRTAGAAAVAAGVIVVAVAGEAAMAGGSLRSVGGLALLSGGLVAITWAFGRSRRRSRVRRDARVAYRAARSAAWSAAADAERLRLAAEVHDTAAHRLTSIAVSAASALHLTDRRLQEDALSHAGQEGRLAAAELAVVENAVSDLATIDGLIGSWPELSLTYRRTVDHVSPQVAAAAYRVVREALTNAARYASGAQVWVGVRHDSGSLTVVIRDSGGEARHDDLGSGLGLTGLVTTVASCGGTFTAGPDGSGWTVCARFPVRAEVPSVRAEWWRGPRAWDAALVGLAFALSMGAALLPGGSTMVSTEQLTVLVPMFMMHAIPLWWRTRSPLWSLAAMVSVHPIAWAVWVAGWSSIPAGDLFLWGFWVELAQVYAFGVCRDRVGGLLAVLLVAAAGGLALAMGPGISGDRAAVWAVLALSVAVLAVPAWAMGAMVARMRARRREADGAAGDLYRQGLSAVARAERERIAAGLRRTASRHAEAVVVAAEEGRLSTVLDEARAGLGAVRGLLEELRRPLGADDPPPTLAGLAVLAARRMVAVHQIGDPRGLVPELEVGVFRVAQECSGRTVTVSFRHDGVLVGGATSRDARRRLHVLADAYGGALTVGTGGTVRVWLPR